MPVLSGLLLALCHLYYTLCVFQYGDDTLWSCLRNPVFELIAYVPLCSGRTVLGVCAWSLACDIHLSGISKSTDLLGI